MKIIADENIPLVEEFFAADAEITRVPGRSLTREQLGDAQALLVRSVTQVNEALLAGSDIQFVGTCTIGMDHLDQSYLQKQGIAFTNAPGCNANSVVEYVYAALCHLNVDWRNRTVGIIGCGNVGGALYRALRAQGVECRCYDPFLTAADNPDLTELEDVLQADIVSMHTPLTTTGPYPSRHLLTKEKMMQLAPGAVLLNCGRGPVVDNQALLQVLRTREDLQVVLDVWETEPKFALPLLDHVRLGSPHIAGYSFDGKLKGTSMIYQAFCKHFGLAEQTRLGDVTPAVANNQLHTDIKASDWAVICDLVGQVYDIEDDDRAMRKLARQSRDHGVDLGQGFDLLRKHYAIRREFNNYQLAEEIKKEPLAKSLAALGFHLNNERD
ncbi:4-phosphoerythronate dehydrogenase [Gilvimarinus chinensis]|uniref:4-phosphoerythronate dehydrogenase n=1 Tax=Gilvimarinus chinensis TaxID=396005 RepID=UPI000365F067|nr:4-phosphoerythronate dehydrogenase [Gilvimarinus chinensis]